MHVESLMTPYHKNGFYRGEVSHGGVGQNTVALQLVSQLQLRVKRYSGPLRGRPKAPGEKLKECGIFDGISLACSYSFLKMLEFNTGLEMVAGLGTGILPNLRSK